MFKKQLSYVCLPLISKPGYLTVLKPDGFVFLSGPWYWGTKNGAGCPRCAGRGSCTEGNRIPGLDSGIPRPLTSPSSASWLSPPQASLLVLSHFSRVRLFATPWTVAHRAPLSMASPGRNTGVGCRALLQGIFPTRGSNPPLLRLLHWQVGFLFVFFYHWRHLGSPINTSHCGRRNWMRTSQGKGAPFQQRAHSPGPAAHKGHSASTRNEAASSPWCRCRHMCPDYAQSLLPLSAPSQLQPLRPLEARRAQRQA